MEFSNMIDAESMLDQCERQLSGQRYTLELIGGQWRLELQTALGGSMEGSEPRSARLTPAGAA
jgi:hypothetical protein